MLCCWSRDATEGDSGAELALWAWEEAARMPGEGKKSVSRGEDNGLRRQSLAKDALRALPTSKERALACACKQCERSR
jgi:hypothetical protein